MKNPKARALGVILVAVVVGVGLVAAGSGAARLKAKFSIAFIPPVLANPAIKALNDAIALKAKSLGMRFQTIGGEYSPQAQIVAMDAAIQKKVSAILIWPLDPKGIQPSFAKAKAAGIPILAVWSPGVPNVDANFQYDDNDAVRKVVALGAAQLKKEGKPCAAGIIEGIPVVNILHARNVGMLAAARATGCTILERQVNATDSNAGALPIAQAWKTKWGGKMTAIFAYNDPSALGAIAALGGGFQPLVTGLNGDADALQAIKAGALFATASQPDVEAGEAMAQVAYQLLNHRAYPRQIDFAYQALTKANINSYAPWDARLKAGPMKIVFVTRGHRTVAKTTPDYTK